MRTTLCLVLILLGSLVTSSASQLTPASEIIRLAQTRAAAENKTILLVFGADWCVKCRVLHAFLDRPEVKSIFDKYTVVAELHAGDDRKSNPGTEKFEKKYHAVDEGYPFMVFLKADGSALIDSKMDKTGDNTGFPEQRKEIKWFMTMLEKGAPQMNASERQTIESNLQNWR